MITADTGAVVTLTDGWKYLTPGNITDIEPAVGQQGTEIVITGNNFFFDNDGTVAKVSLAGVDATIDDSSATQVNITAKESDKDITGDVVITSNTGIAVTAADGFEYFKDGSVDSVEPAQGIGGDTVVIYGNDLRGQGGEVVSVTLSGVTADIARETNFLVQVTAGEGTAGAAGDIVITADTGAVITTSEGWTYKQAANITEVAPAKASAGALITITGEDLRSGAGSVAKVTLAGVEADIQSENDTHVIVEAGVKGSSASATGDVVLTTSSGSVAKFEDGFTYVTRSDIHAISPSSGQFGTSVTITGVELLAGASNVTSITLAGVAVKSITSLSKTKIVVVADEADAAKTGDVVLTSTNGATVELTNGWKYVAPAEITGVNPEEGQIGTRVEIAGTGLLAGGSEVDSLTLAGADVQEILFANDTLIIVTAGANSTAETGTVTYVTDSKAAVESGDDAWTYLEASKIDTVVPDNGQFKTKVVISGSALFGGGSSIGSVTLADAPATVNDGASDTEVTVIAGANAAGEGDVVIKSDTGASTTLEDGFTYEAVAEITSISPSSGQLDTVVTITGTTLLGGGDSIETATLAGTEATITSSNDTHVLVVIQSGTASGRNCCACCRFRRSGHLRCQGFHAAGRRQHHQGKPRQRCPWIPSHDHWYQSPCWR